LMLPYPFLLEVKDSNNASLSTTAEHYGGRGRGHERQ
jgi:hypothetical protein